MRTRFNTAAGALEDLDRAMGGRVVKLRMIGDRSSELAQSLTDLIVLFLFCLLSLSDTPARVEIGLHRSFVAFWFSWGITIDPLRNVFLGIVCKQAHCRTRSFLLDVLY